ncbi:hypothetical protein B4113_0535 [Geobacillus sp. B4113_201601]|nr:hypothetical protein B4113_0535 [Geobacillus sp. B4113_201601]
MRAALGQKGTATAALRLINEETANKNIPLLFGGEEFFACPRTARKRAVIFCALRLIGK